MKRNQKPVRKCHGCGLDFGDHCGVYECPRDLWYHRSCPGYKNEDLLRQYEAEQAKHPVDRSKQTRREVAKQRASEPHYQGKSPMLTSRGAWKPKGRPSAV